LPSRDQRLNFDGNRAPSRVSRSHFGLAVSDPSHSFGKMRTKHEKFHKTHQVCCMQKFTLANLIVSRRTSGQTYCWAASLAMRYLVLVFGLMLIGCASQTPHAKLTLADFENDQMVYSTYLQSYRAGYEAGLRTGARDVCFFGPLSLTATQRAVLRADLAGWSEGNAVGLRQAARNHGLK
jgi:hypothetical protein